MGEGDGPLGGGTEVESSLEVLRGRGQVTAGHGWSQAVEGLECQTERKGFGWNRT